MKRHWLGSLAALTLLSPTALARPYVTIHDDGTFLAFNTNSTMEELSSAFMNLYDASGAPRPQVISVWSCFDLGGESDGTFFLIQGNAIQGIGFDGLLSHSGLLTSAFGPVNAILLHNNVLKLAARATHGRANPDTIGYAQYLFLLEFSHQWLGAARVSGGNTNDLGIWPHWSFWFNTGDSPGGGNDWTDNGDGTFSTVPVDPAQVKYSNVDLYLMGLVDAGAVGTFNVLENAIAPASPTDPLFGGKFAAHSLTDFDATPLTVTATSRNYTIDNIITANGVRDPAESPHNSTLGIVLLVPQNASADQIASYQATFDPIAAALVPAFERATGGIATLTVVTDGGVDLGDAGVDAGPVDAGIVDAGARDAGEDAGVDGGVLDAGPTEDAGGGDDGGSLPPPKGGGCSSGTGAIAPLIAALLCGIALFRRRRGRTE